MNYIKHLNIVSILLFLLLAVFVVPLTTAVPVNALPIKSLSVKQNLTKRNLSKPKVQQKVLQRTTLKIHQKTTAKKSYISTQPSRKKIVGIIGTKTQKYRKKLRVPRPSMIEMITDTTIDAGVRYKHFLYGRHHHSVHVAEVTITDQSLKLGLIKALDRIDGLERLGDMSIRHDSTSRDTLLVGINANFWSAYRNIPIGPMVSAGEVVHMNSYKLWSSAFFDTRNRMWIDHFVLSGRMWMNNRAFKIDNVNERVDSTGLVLYNSFGGNTIPFVSPIDLEKSAQEFLQNHSMVTDDSTELGLNMETLRQELSISKREASIEYPMRKVLLRYLKTPVINRDIPCVVTDIDSGAVPMPLRGCILSFGKNIPMSSLPQKGETIFMKFSTNIADSTQFTTAVSGTPRIVRYGNAKHEAMIEGSHAKRFMNQNLARTSIGTDRLRTKNYFVIVEANNEKGKGATLNQMAGIMKAVGCWNAMNLDGGGSAMMVVCGANACTNSTVPSGRKISAAIGVFRKLRTIKTTEKGR
ncbi:MAG: phosphodiester glycosidase family protein [Ignavibacteriae bacterium]|nr:phosphodiester glycosidase family protein [Ignavibacteriota bacterium]